MATPLGEKIKTLRKERGMTLDTLADLAGMSKSYLWELENRDSPRPSAEKLVGLARALSMDISYFLDDEAATPQPEHLDREFYRHYEQLTPDAKAQMRLIIETFKKS